MILMTEIDKNYNKTFEDIKHIDENGIEFWYARELMPILQYSNWQNFEKIITKAKTSCENSNISVFEHFIDVSKLSKRANNAEVEIKDYKLTRYACYLIAQNGDSRKKVIALAQTYFAVQTRKQEITEKEYSMLTEDEKRFYQRNLTRKGNYSLNQTAKRAGVKNFDKFHNMLKDINEEHRTTRINFAKYKLVMFAMAKLMEMETTEQNKVALYLFNHIKI